MDHRLGRTLRVFLVVLAAAGFYRLTVVPLVEPRLRDAAADLEVSPEEAAAIRARADRRLAALGDVFPPGSWERDDPIMLESRQMRLLFKEYHTLPDGRVSLVPCTLVVLPDRNRVAGAEAGRTLVARAPQGAVLEFDEPLDLRQGRLAKLVGGSLRGQVTIRGAASAPGAEDDIEIVTRDVELDELEVHTAEAVQFRYGRSSGSGRGLVARLQPRDGPPTAGDNGPNIGGVETIRLDRDVRMRLEGFQGSVLPGREPPPPGAGAAEEAPVVVSCRGSLCLNVAANVITLEDGVDVVRATADGATDHLACDLLAILLARRDERPAAEAGAADSPRRSGLEPVEIQAKGAPVVVTSSGAGLEARAARLGYEIATRRILLDGEEPVSLVARGTEMEARKIDYCPGPPGTPGSLMAVGPGWLRASRDGSPPAQARWQQWLRMRPDGDGHVVSISGSADVALEGQGRLAAAEIHCWLDVVSAPPSPAGGAPAATAAPDLSGVRPERLLARGMVEADTAEVAARTDRLELWFRPQPVGDPTAAAAGSQAPSAGTPDPVGGRPALPLAGADPRPPGGGRGRLMASAALLRGLVLVTPGGAQLDELSMEGQVVLVEEPLQPPPAGPPPPPGLSIHGDQLQLSRAMRFDARAVVSGRPARITGRGLDLEGPLVEFDRGRNRLTVDGAGRLALPMPADGGGLDGFRFSGSTPAAPRPAADQPGRLDVVWQGRMDFDGLTARFIDRVETVGGGTTVNAGSLDVVFDRPFEFSGAGMTPSGRQPDIARIACGSGVRIENVSAAAADGERSVERMFVRDLVIDRASGEVTGTGPGRLTSTRFGTSQGLALADPVGGPTARPVSASPRPEPALNYLGVDFQRGLRGNIQRRVMEFHQRVEAIWGPITDWNEALDPHAPGGLPPGVVTVSSDVLSVGQTPPLPGQPRSTIELGAGGNVLVEGESFTARSARLSWSEGKDLLVFEGDGRSDAQLFRQLRPGAQPSSASAGKILYWRGLNRVDVEDARYLDLDQLRGGPGLPVPGVGAAPARPQAPPRPLPGT